MRKWDVNLLVLVGAVLGIVASFMPWYGWFLGGPYVPEVTLPYEEQVASPDDILTGSFAIRDFGGGYPDTAMFTLMILFFIGSIMAVFSPICGLLQVAAAPAFIISIHDDVISGIHYRVWVEYGAWFALLSSIIVGAGLLFPISPRSMRVSHDISRRLFTILPEDIMSSRVNLLAFVGAIVCSCSLALPWATMNLSDTAVSIEYPSSYLSRDLSSIESTIPSVTQIDATFLQIVSFLVVAGSIVAFVSPLGGILSLTGLLLFFMQLQDATGPSGSPLYLYSEWEIQFGAGFALGMAGAIVVLLSLVLPVGLEPRAERITLSQRLLVWGFGDGKSTATHSPRDSPISAGQE